MKNFKRTLFVLLAAIFCFVLMSGCSSKHTFIYIYGENDIKELHIRPSGTEGWGKEIAVNNTGVVSYEELTETKDDLYDINVTNFHYVNLVGTGIEIRPGYVLNVTQEYGFDDATIYNSTFLLTVKDNSNALYKKVYVLSLVE